MSVRIFQLFPGWRIDGNVSLDDTAHFLGTTDATDLVIKTNNATRGIFQSTGELELTATGDYKPLKITANASQTADLLLIEDSGAVALVSVDSAGKLGIGIDPAIQLHVNSNAANTTAIARFENTGGNFDIFRTDADPESNITASIGDLAVDASAGFLYIKNSGNSTNTGWVRIVETNFKSFTFKSRDSASGTNYNAGFYDASSTDANLTQAALTVTHGIANHPYGAHAFIVAGAAGATDGSDLVLTVTGTSIQDDGTRIAADSEIIVSDATTATTDQYFETTKKWIGQITYTLSSTGGTAFNFDFNYGLAKYDDFGNRNFDITQFEVSGLANANDSGFNVELLHHKATGWTYAATGFIPGNGAIVDMNSIYSTEQDLSNGAQFAVKKVGLSTSVAGKDSEGFIIRITTGANNSISFMDLHVGVLFR